MRIKFDARNQPKPTDRVFCHIHGITTTWGELDAVQRLALSEGLDTTSNFPCLLKPRRFPRK